MTFRLTVDSWDAQRAGAQEVRYEVFVLEQEIPLNLEWDEMDAVCWHAVAYDAEQRPIGTGRLLPDGHIGSLAVKKAGRGGGIGAAILTALVQQAQRRGDRCVMLNAQTQAEPFYARYGFVRDGGVFIEAGIPHIHMRRMLE